MANTNCTTILDLCERLLVRTLNCPLFIRIINHRGVRTPGFVLFYPKQNCLLLYLIVFFIFKSKKSKTKNTNAKNIILAFKITL